MNSFFLRAHHGRKKTCFTRIAKEKYVEKKSEKSFVQTELTIQRFFSFLFFCLIVMQRKRVEHPRQQEERRVNKRRDTCPDVSKTFKKK